MVARQSAALRSSVPLQGRSVLANFRKDRPSADRRMDFGGQAERPLSTSDAQIHLEPDATWSLKDHVVGRLCQPLVVSDWRLTETPYKFLSATPHSVVGDDNARRG